MIMKPIFFLVALLIVSCIASHAMDLSSLMVTSMQSDQTDTSDDESVIEIESPEGSSEQEEEAEASPAHNS